MTDQVLMIGHKVEKDLIAETEAEIGVVDPKVETNETNIQTEYLIFNI